MLEHVKPLFSFFLVTPLEGVNVFTCIGWANYMYPGYRGYRGILPPNEIRPLSAHIASLISGQTVFVPHALLLRGILYALWREDEEGLKDLQEVVSILADDKEVRPCV